MTQRTREADEDAVEPADERSGGGRDGAAGERDGERRASGDASHLDDIEDGCGCAEVWEHLSERRAADSD